MKKILSPLLILLLLLPFGMQAQRRVDVLDRGIVAMPKSASTTFISWRHFATDPDDIAYNVYYSKAGGSATKLNSTPITNSTNYEANLKPDNYTFTIKSVRNGVETNEPGSYVMDNTTAGVRIVKEINFAPLPTGRSNMKMKFCWVGDLDGDGVYDYVIDRQGGEIDSNEEDDNAAITASTLLEAYKSDGTFLWRIDLGLNLNSCTGHNDMVTVYDMDGDGKTEVMIAVAEGTIFADGTKVTLDGKVNDYTGKAGSPPQWVSIINGMTGNEIARSELLPEYNNMITNRTDRWKMLGGHFIIGYLDGVKPSLIYQYKNRQGSEGDGDSFNCSYTTWTYQGGQWKTGWSGLVAKSRTNNSEFHQVRVADVDGDGYDDLVEGGYIVGFPQGSTTPTVKIKYKDAVHGDRHTTTDVDPDRPGMEHFGVQQYNGTLVGMGLFDAESGEYIKGNYLVARDDIGRGMCGAFDDSRRGLVYWSVMKDSDGRYSMYDCKGKLIEGAGGPYPSEPLWWGPGLTRWVAGFTGNDKNPVIDRYDSAKKGGVRALNLYSKNHQSYGGNGVAEHYFGAPNGGRAAFWGDIMGDWREELVYAKNDLTGFVILTTWDVTTHRLYHLMQNPAYRSQTTAKGYYQTADVDFYMAHDMPPAPIAPVQTADMYYSGSGWVNAAGASQSYTDNKSIMFDVRSSANSYALNTTMSPSRVWVMNPRGKDYTIGGSGKFTGAMDFIKSMQGKATLNGNHDYTGTTRVSEGTLYVNGTLASKVQVDARGVIGGNGTLNGGIVMNEGLNTEGGCIEPGNGTAGIGTLTIKGNLALVGRNNLAFDVDAAGTNFDHLQINGNFTIAGENNTIVINKTTLAESVDKVTLITYTGTSDFTIAKVKVKGLEGIPHTLIHNTAEKKIQLDIDKARAAGTLTWAGTEGGIWNFTTKNFLNGSTADTFVPKDKVNFTDAGTNKTINVEETMPVGNMTFTNSNNYTITGEGVISGTGTLTKTGTGTLRIENENNEFTGKVTINGGVLEVMSIKDGGYPSSIGKSAYNAANWVMKDAVLRPLSQMVTNRQLTIQNNLQVDCAANTALLISGAVGGAKTSSLDVTGAGRLTLSNKYVQVGAVTVRDGGTLVLGTAEANWSLGNFGNVATATVTLNNGTLSMYNITTSSGGSGTFVNTIDVPAGANSYWTPPAHSIANNKLTGTGTIEISLPGTRLELMGDWSAFGGVIKFTNPKSGGQVRLNSTTIRNFPLAEVNLGENTKAWVTTRGDSESTANNTFVFGALSGVGNVSGRNTLEIGGRNTNSEFSGVITAGSGKLTKNGTGSLTLSGANLYTGVTTVNGGTLVAANTSGSATGTGAVTVNNSGTLAGSGTITGAVTVNAGGTIMPGVSTSKVGTLKLSSSLTINDGANTVIKLAGEDSDLLDVTGKLTLAGTLSVKILNGVYSIGTEYRLYKAGSKEGKFTTVQLPTNGFEWDTSRLDSEGIIKLTYFDPTSVEDAENAVAAVYPTIVKDVCTLSLQAPVTDGRVDIITTTGLVLNTQVISNDVQEHILNLSDYARGFYFIRLIAEGKQRVYRVVKE